jgi:carboxymethylenebutenolidase
MLTSSQTLESYDEDSRKTVDYLLTLPTCAGRIGSTGMCLGGHLALRATVSPHLLHLSPLTQI